MGAPHFLLAIYRPHQNNAIPLHYNLLDSMWLCLMKGILHHLHQILHQYQNNQLLIKAYV